VPKKMMQKVTSVLSVKNDLKKISLERFLPAIGLISKRFSDQYEQHP